MNTQENTQTMEHKNTIPEGWQETTLGKIGNVNPTEHIKKGEVATNIPMESLDPFTRKISRRYKKVFNGGMKFKNGDTLLARITPCLENGKTAFVTDLEQGEVAFGSTEYIVFREKDGLSDGKFLFYFTISPNFRDLAIKAMTGTSGRQRVQTDVLINKNLLFPPIEEQRAIASVLSSFDDKIELLREQNKTLETLAQTIFHENFGKYKPGDDLPPGWRIGKLSEIANFLNGLALQKFSPKKDGHDLPVIKIRELKNGITSQTDLANANIPEKYIITNGDILFSWSGSLEVVMWKYGKGALNQHLFKVESKIYPKWFYYLWTLHHLENFKNIAANKATTMGHIQRHHLDSAGVIIPSKSDIEKFDKIFSPLLDKFALNNEQIQSLSKTRDALLSKLITGKLRVKNV